MIETIWHHPSEKPWWFVCCVVAGQEMEFRKELALDGIVNFSPVKKVLVQKKMKGGGIKTVVKYVVLFSGYVFVLGEYLSQFLESEWRYLICVLKIGQVIGRIDHSIIDNLLKQQIRNEFDKVPTKKEHDIKAGDTVSVSDEYKNGVFYGMKWKVLYVQRKRVMLVHGTMVCKISVSFVHKTSDRRRTADSSSARRNRRKKRRSRKKDRLRASPS